LVFWTTIELPAVVVLGFWIVIQIFISTPLPLSPAGGVAYMAHIGGFAAGLVLCLLLRRQQQPLSMP
jgi:membrane associated rhomboid family serine protease